MTGSSLAPVIIPIVVTISLAAWLLMVYYADNHPRWKSASPAPGHQSPGQVTPITGAGNDQFPDGQLRRADEALVLAGADAAQQHTAAS